MKTACCFCPAPGRAGIFPPKLASASCSKRPAESALRQGDSGTPRLVKVPLNSRPSSISSLVSGCPSPMRAASIWVYHLNSVAAKLKSDRLHLVGASELGKLVNELRCAVLHFCAVAVATVEPEQHCRCKFPFLSPRSVHVPPCAMTLPHACAETMTQCAGSQRHFPIATFSS